jgi:hypothetical protein
MEDRRIPKKILTYNGKRKSETWMPAVEMERSA